MDELSPLFQSIEFNERFRGYDADEVDAYVDRVAKAAALVQGRIGELQDRVEAAESRQVPLEADRVGAGVHEQDLAKVLVLAQRTADAAVDEAMQEAELLRNDAEAAANATRTEAEDHATMIMAEAETDRRAIMAKAEAESTAYRMAEIERISHEITELERYRAFLQDDIGILEAHVSKTREMLSFSVASLTELVERPEVFEPAAMPALSAIERPAMSAGGSADEAETQDTIDEVDPVDGDVAEVDLDLTAIESAPAEEPQSVEARSDDTSQRPVFVTAADLSGDDSGIWSAPEASIVSPSTAQVPVADTLLFAEPQTQAEDPYQAQLRDAVSEEDVEPQVDAFFEEARGGDDQGWFNQRR